jgi:hypothetical protein
MVEHSSGAEESGWTSIKIDIKGISRKSGCIETNLRKLPGVNATQTGSRGFRAAVYFFDSEEA